VVKGGANSSGAFSKKPKVKKQGGQNEASAQLNKKYMEELLTREKHTFDNQITSLKLQHEKLQDDIFK